MPLVQMAACPQIDVGRQQGLQIRIRLRLVGFESRVYDADAKRRIRRLRMHPGQSLDGPRAVDALRNRHLDRPCLVAITASPDETERLVIPLEQGEFARLPAHHPRGRRELAHILLPYRVRVVVAGDEVGGNARFVQPVQPLEKPKVVAICSLRSIECVTCQDDEIDLVGNRRVDNALVCLRYSFEQPVCPRIRQIPEAAHRSAKVDIGSM